MRAPDLDRVQAEYLDSIDLSFEPWSPDGLKFHHVILMQRDVYAELAREDSEPPTTWLAMSDEERATIRAARRPLRVVSAPIETSTDDQDAA